MEIIVVIDIHAILGVGCEGIVFDDVVSRPGRGMAISPDPIRSTGSGIVLEFIVVAIILLIEVVVRI